MAVIRDVMPMFELYQPASVDDALALVEKHGADAWVLAGGLDSMDWLKDRLRKPKVVVDLSNIAALRGIREANGGLEIGAMTTLTDVVRHPVVREKYALLREAAELVASRIRRALEYVPAERLMINPDCGLRHLAPDVARQKLRAMVAGVALVRAELPGGQTS